MKMFEEHIKGAKPVVVDFTAEWCPPCKLMLPVLHEVKEQVGDRATVLKLDIDQYPESVKLFNIRAVPTLIIFKDGKMLWRKSGIIPSHEILQHLKIHIA
jgi:thioredoxin 1